MNLIDRYVYTVLRHIPVAQKEDIEKEIRSMIADMLQEKVKERTGATGPIPDIEHTASAEDIGNVLVSLGDPADLARKFAGSGKYVIGPALYDTYWLVLRIVLIAVGIGLLIARSIQVVTDSLTDGWSILAGYLSIYQGLLSAFAMVTLIFILIEHFGGEEVSAELKTEKKAWKLDDLPEIPQDKLRIKRGDPIAAIIFTLIFLAIINVSPQLFGFYQQTDSGMNIIGFLGEGFRTFLVWINLSLIIGLVLEAVKLAYARWTFFLIVSSLGKNILSLVVGLMVVRHPLFISPDFVAAINEFLAKNNVAVTVVWQNYLVTGFTVLIVFGFVVETITLAAKGFRLMQTKLAE